MSRWYGSVGYAEEVETSVDVYEEQIVEREYVGDVIKDYRKLNSSNYLNDNVTINNRISIVADPYAYSNFHSIRYCTYMGTKWKVTGIEVQYPRLILDIGGVFSEQSP